MFFQGFPGTERSRENIGDFQEDKNMRSDAVRKGMQQAPHRSLFNALGMTEEEMNKP